MRFCGINTLRPRQNRRHFADAIFKCIFLNENVWLPIKISLKFVPQGPINNIPALVQMMAWRRPGDKPLSGPMMVRLPTHICVTRPQWVNFTSEQFHNECPSYYSIFNEFENYTFEIIAKHFQDLECHMISLAIGRNELSCNTQFPCNDKIPFGHSYVEEV